MTRKDMQTDPRAKWLPLIGPLVAADLSVRIDPRRGVDDDTAHRLQIDAVRVPTIDTVFVTSHYNNVLAAEVTDDPDEIDEVRYGCGI